MNHAEVLAQYLGTFVDELVASGLEHVCLCPGSRSTPLALTFARHPGIKVWTHLDERSCAYFALGMTRHSWPVAILCSSGTAAVNFAPAVVEAQQSHAPLIVLTADRPQELRDLGANQTIDQVRLYGSAVKWFVEMPLPEATDTMLRYVKMVARRAFLTARGGLPGPVHLNFPFREPLIPGSWEGTLRDTSWARGKAEEMAREIEDDEKNGVTHEPAPVIQDVELREVVLGAKRGLIICGQGSYGSDLDLRKASAWLGFPVLADPLSDERYRYDDNATILGAYDAFLRSPSLVESLRPDLILRFGNPPTSKPLASYLNKYRDVPQILVAEDGHWPDPDLAASDWIRAEAGVVWSELAAYVDETERDKIWLRVWQDADYKASAVAKSIIESDAAMNEPAVFTDLAKVIPLAAGVFAGNSMPVRDLDSFWPVTEKVNFFYANRGASGIDGVVSTALGTAAVSPGRVVLVIGDLSFYHDMNGLLAAKRHGLKATIVLINNDGGGIFSFLPQNDDQEHFELLFGTPHGLDFEPVAKLYGLGWTRVTTREEYRNALKASFDAEGVQVIEVKTDRVENLKLHQRIWTEVAKAVEGIEVEAST